MSGATAEVIALSGQQEAMAQHMEHPTEAPHQHDHLHTNLAEAAHGHEGPCGPECQHHQLQANEISNNLFAEIETDSKKEVCGCGSVNCEHTQTRANLLSDDIFAELVKPEDSKPQVKPAKTEVDMHAANKVAQEFDHDHKPEEPHICHAKCEHSQPQADAHADSLFSELDTNPPEAQKTPGEAIIDQIRATTKEEAQQHEGGHLSEQAARARTPEADTALRQYIEAAEAAQAVSVAAEDKTTEPDARPSVTLKPQEYVSSVTSQDTLISPVVIPLSETVPATIVGDGAHGSFNASKNAKETTGVVDAESLFETVDLGRRDGTNILDSTEQVSEDFAPRDETIAEGLLEANGTFNLEQAEPSPLLENDEIDLSRVAEDIDTTQNTDEASPRKTELEPEQKAIVNELAALVKPESAPEVSDMIAAIIEQLEAAKTTELSEAGAVTARVPGVEAKLEELATNLSIDYAELLEMLQLTTVREIIHDQQLSDILRGLRKDLSIEYSLEFSQASLSQPTSGARTLIQTLGQFILLFLARSKQSEKLLTT